MNNKNKMGVWPIPRLVWEMSLPPIISMFLQYSYNFIDAAFVAQISEDALAAISFSFPITTLMIATSVGIGVGINVLVAKFLGENNQEMANTITTTGILVASCVGIVMNTVIYLLLEPYFRLYITDPAIFTLAITYMRICVFLQVPNMVHVAIQKTLQGTGNMIVPMVCQSVGAIFNIIFDPILIFGWGIFPAMGIEGAALSTVLGYTLPLMMISYYLFFHEKNVKVRIRGFSLNLHLIKEIFIIGFPSFILNVLGAFMTTLINVFLVGYSYTAVAFFGAYYKLQHIVVMSVNGLIQGCLPIMSFNYGGRRMDRLNETFRYGLKMSFWIMSLGALLVMIFPDQLLRLFQASPAMIAIGQKGMLIMPLSFSILGMTTMIASYMQAINQVRASILINLLRQLLLLIPIVWLLSSMFGLLGIWAAFPITELLSLLIAWQFFRKRKVLQ